MKNQFALAKQGRQFGAGRVHPIVVSVAAQRGEGNGDIGSAGDWNGEDVAADGGVVGVLRGDGGDDQIVRVVSTGEKNADERLVVADRVLRDGGIDEAQVADGGAERTGAERGAGGLANESTPGDDGNRFVFHRLIVERRIRGS